ncbi:MAG: hypothetical protein U1E49_19925 [Hyphomicrobiaceae bacterium]
MTRFLKHVLELFGIVYLRFRAVPRLWCVWLVGVNAACLLYITHVEAQAVLLVTAIAVAAQALIYGRIGFTRILGAVHLMWVPMFAWFATRAGSIASDPGLAHWIVLLFATNTVSLIVDAVDSIRFLRGERAPHYRWARA